MESKDRREFLKTMLVTSAVAAIGANVQAEAGPGNEAGYAGNAVPTAARVSAHPGEGPGISMPSTHAHVVAHAKPAIEPTPLTDVSAAKQKFGLEDSENWQKIVKDLRTQYPLLGKLKEMLAGQLSEDDKRTLLAVDHGFDFAQSTSTNDTIKDELFSPRQVETLLDQAADLLDRGLRVRSEYDELTVRAFDSALELDEFQRLDQIHDEEIQAGLYTVNYETDHALLISQEEWLSHKAEQLTEVAALLNKSYSPQEMNRQKWIAGRSAFFSHLPYYNDQLSSAKDVDAAKYVRKATPALYQDEGFVAKKVVSEHPFTAPTDGSGDGTNFVTTDLELLAQESTGFQVETQLSNVRAQLQAIIADMEAGKKALEGKRKSLTWEGNNTQYQWDRYNVSRFKYILKFLAATDENGALNFVSRREPVQHRFQRDLRDAVARMRCAQRGLSTLFGYTVPLPDATAANYFDECLLWTRDAVSWVVSFTQQDQNYVLPISVRHLLEAQSNGSSWKAALESGIISITIPEEFFSGQTHIRMRGVCAYAVSKFNHNLWQATVQPPKEGFYIHRGSRGGLPAASLIAQSGVSPGTILLSQPDVPPCHLARIQSRDNIRDADIVGRTALYNATPIGTWTIHIPKVSTTGTKADKLEDLHLDLLLAVQAG